MASLRNSFHQCLRNKSRNLDKIYSGRLLIFLQFLRVLDEELQLIAKSNAIFLQQRRVHGICICCYTPNKNKYNDRSSFFICSQSYHIIKIITGSLQAIENFALTVKEMAQMLQSFGTELAETELPDDIPSIEEILAIRAERYHLLKVCLIELTNKRFPWSFFFQRGVYYLHFTLAVA